METIKNNSRGTAVKILQTYLKVEVDGIFGKKTAAAVNEWKEKKGMGPDGTFCESDWNLLAQSLPTIKLESTGIYVKMWQLFLGITVDGQFGSKTKASTRAYQEAAKLTVDGIVGRNTWVAALTTKVAAETPISNSNSTQKKGKNEQPKNFKQYDSKWGSVVYTKNNTYSKKQTIKNSGCGPTSMADIVATWWNNSVTPKTLAALSVQNGYRTENSGTAWGFFKYCAQKYGASKFIQTTSYATAEAAIKDGAYVVCSMKPGLFTKGGHFICWWWTDGVYNYTNDPASAAAKRAKQEVKYIKNECKQYFIFYK